MVRHCAITVILVFCLVSAGTASDRLAVHEWGTFTSFQNEDGKGLRRINTDDEPVPSFVHQLRRIRLFSPTEMQLLEREHQSQGAPYADPRFTMRLETPVIYFHLPPGAPSVTLDVSVEFQQGFLTEFFPLADALVDGQLINSYQFPLGGVKRGSLRWKGVRVGEAGHMPETTDHVWLAPRQVDAAPVTIGQESERFLFYRGVGDIAAPLLVIRNADQLLQIRIDNGALMKAQQQATPAPGKVAGRRPQAPPVTVSARSWEPIVRRRQLWLLEVRRDGAAAFRRLPDQETDKGFSDCLVRATPGRFPDSEFSKANLMALRGEMREALIGEGLFGDEADALLNTWDLSYFRSPGQRLFFLVPRDWTDAILPLKLSVPAEVSRAMVGRIELVTPQQRELVAKIAATPIPDLTAVVNQMRALQQDPARREEYNALASGRGDSSILGDSVPPVYQAYLDLGRFRTALVLDAMERDALTDSKRLQSIRYLQYELMYPGKLKRD